MSLTGYVTGLPGAQSAVTASHRIVFRDGIITGWKSGGGIIDGTKTRDPGNTSDLNILRAGLVMGKLSTGKYTNSIIGASNAAYAAGATSLTLTSTATAEIIRRIGTSGTFKIAGPPSAAGVVNVETVTFSALDSATYIATVTALANSYISGSLILPNDGSEDFITLIPDGYGKNMFLADGTASDQQWGDIPTAGTLIAANILNYPSDASLKSWFRAQFRYQGGPLFMFDDAI